MSRSVGGRPVIDHESRDAAGGEPAGGERPLMLQAVAVSSAGEIDEDMAGDMIAIGLVIMNYWGCGRCAWGKRCLKALRGIPYRIKRFGSGSIGTLANVSIPIAWNQPAFSLRYPSDTRKRSISATVRS